MASSSPVRTRAHGRGIYGTDKNNIQPRVGHVVGPVFRRPHDACASAYGVYYDQVLTGIFLQNAFVNPPFVGDAADLESAAVEPGGGDDAGHAAGAGVSSRPAIPSKLRESSSGTSAFSASSTTAA